MEGASSSDVEHFVKLFVRSRALSSRSLGLSPHIFSSMV